MLGYTAAWVYYRKIASEATLLGHWAANMLVNNANRSHKSLNDLYIVESKGL